MNTVLLAMPFWQNVLQLIGALVTFIAILVATYYTTKWIGKSGIVQSQSKNISVVETFRLAPNKFVQIVKVGKKYYAIAIAKETISLLGELSDDDLDLSVSDVMDAASFKEVLSKVLPKQKHND